MKGSDPFPGYIWSGQLSCHDAGGQLISCEGSGQDAEFQRGIPWPEKQFQVEGGVVRDRLTNLLWLRDANIAGFPLTWQEAFDYVHEMNRVSHLGFDDWRVPNRRELYSLLSFQAFRPALPEGHPFRNVFPGWYWTSTTAAITPSHAWYIHMEGARMFYGGKDQSFLLWPLRGGVSSVLPASGQKLCYDNEGKCIDCIGSGQDGEFQYGAVWPEPRFHVESETIYDHLTRLCWMRRADLTGEPATWSEALSAVDHLNDKQSGRRWRLPGINELESLVDCSQWEPALSRLSQLEQIRKSYWSSTTSLFEPDWAWALYLEKGAVGVGQKTGRHFHVWPVCDRA